MKLVITVKSHFKALGLYSFIRGFGRSYIENNIIDGKWMGLYRGGGGGGEGFKVGFYGNRRIPCSFQGATLARLGAVFVAT